MWIKVSTGLELDLDFRAEDAQAVLGMATVFGTPSKRSRPVGNDRPGQSGAGVGASAVQAGDPHMRRAARSRPSTWIMLAGWPGGERA